MLHFTLTLGTLDVSPALQGCSAQFLLHPLFVGLGKMHLPSGTDPVTAILKATRAALGNNNIIIDGPGGKKSGSLPQRALSDRRRRSGGNQDYRGKKERKSRPSFSTFSAADRPSIKVEAQSVPRKQSSEVPSPTRGRRSSGKNGDVASGGADSGEPAQRDDVTAAPFNHLFFFFDEPAAQRHIV